MVALYLSVGGQKAEKNWLANTPLLDMAELKNVWDRIMRKGKRISGPDFTVYHLRLSAAPRPRIVVSQKVDKRAVVRNKIRRRLRSILNQILPPGTGLVIIARPKINQNLFR